MCLYLKILNLISSKRFWLFFFWSFGFSKRLVPWFDPSINSIKKRFQVRSRSQASECTGTCTLQYKEPGNTGLNQVTHACKTPYMGPWRFTFLNCLQQQKNKQTNPKKIKKNKKIKISQFLGYIVPNHNEKTNPKKIKFSLSLATSNKRTNKQKKKNKVLSPSLAPRTGINRGSKGVIPGPPRRRPRPIDETVGCAGQPESDIVMCVRPQRSKKFCVTYIWVLKDPPESIIQATKSARDWFLFQQLQSIKLLTS